MLLCAPTILNKPYIMPYMVLIYKSADKAQQQANNKPTFLLPHHSLLQFFINILSNFFDLNPKNNLQNQLLINILPNSIILLH